MNEEFLYRLRKDPPPEFAARLKAKLDVQTRKSLFAPRSSLVRTLAVAILIGGSALAAAILAVKGVPAGILDLFGGPDKVSIATKVSTVSHAAVADGVNIPREQADRPSELASEPSAPQPTQHSDATTVVRREQAAAESGAYPSMVARTPATEFTGPAGAPSTRNYIRIVGSSATHALVKAATEYFSRIQRMQAPQIESRGVAAVFRGFCSRSGTRQPDMAIASGRITTAELAMCRGNGVTNIVELKIGYQAIVLTGAKMGSPLKLATRDVYLALAKQIPDPADPTKLIDNPNRTWDQVNQSLEVRRIEVLGPPPESTARRAFAEYILEAGCDTYAWIRELKSTDEKRYQRICHTLREDGVYVDAEQTSTLITQRLWAEPNALAVLDYSFYERNKDHLIGNLLEGADPTLESIAAGAYPGSRTLYIYINKVRVSRIPRFSYALVEYLSERGIGPGLIPLDEEERRALRANALQLNELKF